MKITGQAPTPKLLNSLLSERPSSSNKPQPNSSEYNQGLNFTTFLTLMSERLLELDEEDVLKEAFECFDENDMGTLDGKELREWLGTVGDRMTKEEIDKLLSPPFGDRHGTFNYRDFMSALRVSEADGMPPIK